MNRFEVKQRAYLRKSSRPDDGLKWRNTLFRVSPPGGAGGLIEPAMLKRTVRLLVVIGKVALAIATLTFLVVGVIADFLNESEQHDVSDFEDEMEWVDFDDSDTATRPR